MYFSRTMAALVLALAPLAAQTVVIQPTSKGTVTETRSLPLASGSTLTVKNVNGGIKVEGWDKAEVSFTGEFKPSSDDEHVKVVMEPGSGKLDIVGEYPKRSGVRFTSPQCQMTLKVPHNLNVKFVTVNGGVQVVNLNGTTVAETVNGGIELEGLKGGLELKSVNGGIKGKNLDSQGKAVAARTVNGGIRLQVSGLKGQLKATTVNGSVSFNAKGAENVEVKRTKVTATFPGGTESISLSTVNGSITLE